MLTIIKLHFIFADKAVYVVDRPSQTKYIIFSNEDYIVLTKIRVFFSVL